MASNLAQLLVRVRRYIKEVDPTTSFWNDNMLKSMLNSQYLKRAALMIMADEGAFLNVSVADIVGGTARYAFPDGLQRLNRIELVREDGTLIPIERWERRNASNPGDFSIDGESYFGTYRLISNGFILEPTPSEDVTGGLQIEWSGIPQVLSGDGDTMHASFPSMFEELIVLDTACNAFDAEGNMETGSVRALLRQRAEWEEIFERFIETKSVSQQRTEPFTGHYEDA